MKRMLIVFFTMLSFNAISAEDVITISKVFSTTDGRFAFQSVNEAPNANTEETCHPENANWAKRWFGFQVTDSSRALVSLILSAHARGQKIMVASFGCEGHWHKATAVYSDY